MLDSLDARYMLVLASQVRRLAAIEKNIWAITNQYGTGLQEVLRLEDVALCFSSLL